MCCLAAAAGCLRVDWLRSHRACLASDPPLKLESILEGLMPESTEGRWNGWNPVQLYTQIFTCTLPPAPRKEKKMAFPRCEAEAFTTEVAMKHRSGKLAAAAETSNGCGCSTVRGGGASLLGQSELHGGFRCKGTPPAGLSASWSWRQALSTIFRVYIVAIMHGRIVATAAVFSPAKAAPMRRLGRGGGVWGLLRGRLPWHWRRSQCQSRKLPGVRTVATPRNNMRTEQRIHFGKFLTKRALSGPGRWQSKQMQPGSVPWCPLLDLSRWQ